MTSKTLVLVWVSTVFAVGCQACQREAPTETTPVERATSGESTDQEDSGQATTEPSSSEAGPVTIRVVNDTAGSLTFFRSFGPAQFFGISRLDGSLPPMTSFDQEDDERSVNWDSTCNCECGDPPCPECEPPPDIRVTLEAGESHEYSWNGRLRRLDRHSTTGDCYRLFNPPAGRYVLTACTEEHRCGRTEVSLPSTGVITISMSSTSQTPDCSAVNDFAAQRASTELLRTLLVILRDRPVDSCPEAPRCVSSDAIESQQNAARNQDCAVFVIPRGDTVEVRAFLPIPPTHHGGETYSWTFDPDLTHIISRRYTQ